MQQEAGQQRHKRFLFRCLVGAGIVVLLGAAWWAVRYGPVEVAIRGFASSPSQAKADTLTALLDKRRPTRRQGTRILKLLLGPEVTTRTAYPAGQPAKISMNRRFHMEMPRGRIVVDEFVWAAGRPIDACREATNRLSSLPQILDAWVRPPEPGTYQAQIRTECRIMHAVRRPTRSALWDRLRARLQSRLPGLFRARPWTSEELTYRCRFVTSFDVNIVERDRAERLESVSGSPIDETVRAAIATETSRQQRSYATPAGWRGYYGSTSVAVKRLPIPVAFELSLRLADGRELPAGTSRQPQHIRVRAGDPWNYVVDVGSFGLTEPGEYVGTLVLRPDPDYAYEDPAIKSIRNGTLEFPISFVVYMRTQAQ